MLIINLIIRDFNVKVHDDLIIMFIYKILVFIAGITTYIICRVLYTPDIFSYSGKDFWIGVALSSWWVILLAFRTVGTKEWEKRNNVREIQESINPFLFIIRIVVTLLIMLLVIAFSIIVTPIYLIIVLIQIILYGREIFA